MATDLSISSIQENLKTQIIGQKIIVVPSIDSTNTEIKRIAQNLHEGTVLFAEYQEAGHGRWSRKWVAPSKKALLFSIYLTPDCAAEQNHLFTIIMALSVVQAVYQIDKVKLDIVWPNDIYYDGKKLAGVLTECVYTGSSVRLVVVGCGMNIHQINDELSLDQTRKGISLDLVTNYRHDRSLIAASILNQFEGYYSDLLNGNIQSLIHLWESYCSMMHQTVQVRLEGETVEGEMVGIDHRGNLILKQNNETFILKDGDVIEVKHVALH